LLSVELAWRETQVRRDAGDASPSLALADAIFEYWRAFGAWTSCARDLRPYAELIAPEAARASLRDALGRAAAEIDLAEEKGEKQNPAERNRATRRAAAAESVRAALGLCGGSWRDASSGSGGIKGLSMPRLVNPAEGRALARTFIAKYRRARRLVPENADPREPVPGDAFAALGAQALAAEAVSWAARGLESGDTSGVGDASGDGEVVMSLLACCALSEEALRASPNHAELRLVLVTAYSLLGASTAASDALAPLDVKNIQMDTMAHFVLSCSESGCAPSVLLKYCRLAERLRLDAKRDIAEAGVKAYENGAFTKALEFVDFHARLANSHAARKFAAASARVALRETMLSLGDATVEPHERHSGRFPESLVNVLDEAVEALGPLESDASPTRDADEFAKTFNEDATLNPTFAPPFHGDAGLSACDWWAGPARSPDAGTSEKVPVGGEHDKGVGFGVSVAHRAGWARALRRRVVELHALRLAARVADADAGVFEEETENVAAVVAAAEALAEGGRADAAPGDAWARARAPVTAAAARVSDAALRALARLIALRTASGAGAGAAARDAAEAIDAYADAFSSLCGGATAGLLGDASAREPPGPLAERAAARGAVPLLFHAVAEAGATATATLRAYACALAAKRCPGFASLEKGARESLAGAARRASGTVAAAVRAAAAAADATASGEGKEADALADRVDKWMGILAERKDPHDGRELGRALRREVCEDVARRIVAAHRVALNAVKAHADRFAALAEETADTLSRA
jgi:N-terminal acetyltransferase B complex non-catalytic subunit